MDPEGFNPEIVALARQAAAGAAVSPDQLDDVLIRMPRGDRLYHIFLFHGAFGRETLRHLLSEWWTDAEFPTGLGTGRIVELFRSAGFVTDTEGTLAPAGPLTVYRGVRGGSRPRALSWTLDEAKAEWFARRFAFDRPGELYAAEVQPEAVLGIFHGRAESEVVVDPRHLRKIRLLRQVSRDEDPAD